MSTSSTLMRSNYVIRITVIGFLFAFMWLCPAMLQSAVSPPATWTQSVTYNNQTVTMRLTLQNLRGSHFELWAQNATGAYSVITPVAERSYLGTVDEHPGAVSFGILQDDGSFRGGVVFDRGGCWNTLNGAVTRTSGLTQPTFFNPATNTVSEGHGGSTMYAFDVGIDARFEYFQSRGASNIAKTFECIEYSVAEVRALYMTNALLRPYLARVIIRTDSAKDPAFGVSGNYLGILNTEWTTNHASANRDIVAGITSGTVGGGYAWVGAIGASNGYSVNDSDADGNFAVVWRHELGHNWGLSHYDGGAPEGGTINSNNNYARMSGPELEKALSQRDAKLGFLDNHGTYTAVNLPPYAALDCQVIIQTVDTSVAFNVLANDHDANGHALSLTSFAATSAKGGTIVKVGQSLIYTPPSGAFIGSDFFTYVVTDSTNMSATGVATIDVQPNDPLRLYLPLNETSGPTLADVSSFRNSGTLNGATVEAATVPGKFGNAIDFPGTGRSISVPNVRLNSNTVTITAWIKPRATQNAYAGIVFDRTNQAGGLNMHNDGKLRYHWGGTTSYTWNSGLTPPVDVWTFVALVVEPTKSTIYMNAGPGFVSAVNAISHPLALFGTTYIGQDSNFGDRVFNGAIDDVRIYNYAMTQTQLQGIYAGGTATSPIPVDQATGVTLRTLTWSSAANALSNKIYLGTSLAAVTAATDASPEYKGATNASSYLASLADATTYYWRIDTVHATGTTKGTIWSFTTGTIQVGNTLLVNFQRSGGESFSGGQAIGPTLADSSNWNSVAGASGSMSNLINNIGEPTPVGMTWSSSTNWSNSDGTGDDDHKLSVGYLDDGNSGSGKGATVTISNIPYANYRVYGLFATDQNGSGSCGIVNVNVNGTWALGGNATTTASAWGGINANNTVNGQNWTKIVPGSVQGNYWTVNTSGPTCTIVSEVRYGSNRGCLTGIIIENVSTTPTVTFTTASQSSVSESGTMTVTAQLSAPSAQAVTVPFTVTGSATPGTDFTIPASPITIAAGATTGSATLAIISDTIDEPNETVILTMGTPTNATKGATTVHTATITDDDAANTPPTANAGPDQSVTLSSGPWSPTAVATAAWYDASDTGTITHSGGAVSQLRDKSGNNRHVSGGTSKPITGTRTMNGLNVLDFDNNDYLDNSANITAQAYSFAVVASVDASGQDNTLFDANGAQRSLVRRRSTNTLGMYAGAWGTDVSGPATGGFLVSGAFNGASSQIRADGGAAATSNPGSGNLSEGITIGNVASPSTTYDHDGTIGEILISSGVWTATDREKIEGYLAHKWGLTGRLPASHPYKAAAPTELFANATLDGTATDADSDTLTYTWTVVSGPGTVTLTNAAAIDTTATFTVAGTYTLRLTVSDGFAQTTDDVVITVNGPSSTPSVAFTAASQASVSESGTLTVTAQLSAPSAQNVTVPFTVSGSATSGTDYTITASPITITAGATTGTATITIISDTVDEPNETVVLTMGTPTNATKGATTVHTATITDDDAMPTVTFTAAGQTSAGESGTLVVTAQLSNASSQAVTVPFTVSGSASSGTDYTITASPITIAAGATSGTATITIISDTVDEPNETVVLTMGTPTNATKGATTVHTATITDDDFATSLVNGSFEQPALPSNGYQYNPTGSGWTFISQAGMARNGSPWYSVAAPDGVQGAFLQRTGASVSQTLTLGAGTYSVTFSVIGRQTYGSMPLNVTIDGNTVLSLTTAQISTNAWTSFTTNAFTLGAGNHTLAFVNGTLSGDHANVIDKVTLDAVPVSRTVAWTTASQSSVNESGTLTVTAQLSAASEQNITVPFTVTGTATSGTDYTITASPITIAAGATSGTATISIIADTIDEPNETVVLTMGTPTNATKGATSVHTATITDDDAMPTVTFTAAGQASVGESGTLVVTAQLTNASSQSVTVPFTVSGSATSGADYTITASPITIAAGALTGTATITIVTDTIDEPNETVVLTMGAPTNATAGATTVHTATITDDDATPTVMWTSASQASANESGTMTVTAQLSATSSQSVTVPFTVTGTATSGTDYTITASPIVIAAGASSGSATITINSDTVDEPNETVVLTIGTPTNATKGATAVHTATITDDDAVVPTVTIITTDPDANEAPGDPGEFTVQMSTAATSDITVNLNVSGTATSGTDYLDVGITVIIPAGQLSSTVTVESIDDTKVEKDETVIVTLVAGAGYQIGTADSGTVTIFDDDKNGKGKPNAAGLFEDGSDSSTSKCGVGSGISAFLLSLFLMGMVRLSGQRRMSATQREL